MRKPAFTRLPTDERRAQLLELAEKLFTTHTYGELSMARIAREAGISKALLYHYFPSKEAFFRATLQEAVEDLVARTQVDETLTPVAQLSASLDAYLDWVDAHTGAYGKLMRTAMEEEWVRELASTACATPRPRGSSRASPRPGARRRPRRGRRSARGCGSWTAPAWTGSSTATSTARSCSACCSAPWRAP